MVGILVIAALVLGSVAVGRGVLDPQIYDWMFAAAMVATFWGLLPRTGLPRRWAGPVSLALGALAIGAQLIWPQIRLAPYMAIAVINLGVAYIFASGLVMGREPILLQLIRMMKMGPEAPPDFRRFVTRQCVLWAGLGAVTGALGCVAMVAPSTRALLTPGITGLILGQVAWFILSHHYATWRYKRAETWQTTMRVMARPATWTDLKI